MAESPSELLQAYQDSEERAEVLRAHALATLLDPEQQAPVVDAPILEALKALAQALDLPFDVPGFALPDDPVEAFEAVATHNTWRYRAVTLEPGWERRDLGPLLAFHAAGGSPLALLPRKPGRYDLFDPVRERRGPLGPADVAQIQPTAVLLYRMLPLRPLEVRDWLTLGWRLVRPEVPTILAMAAAGAVLGLAIPRATMTLVAHILPQAEGGLLLQVGVALLAVTLMSAVFRLVQDFAVLRAETTAEHQLEAAFWDRLLRLEMGFFRRIPAGDLAQRLGAVNQIRRTLAGTTLQSVSSSVFALVFLIQLYTLSAPMATAALLVGLGGMAFMWLASDWVRKAAKRGQKAQGDSQAFLLTMIEGLPTLRIFGAQRRALGEWTQLYVAKAHAGHETNRATERLTLFSDLLPILAIAVTYAGFTHLAQTLGQTASVAVFAAFGMALTGYLNGCLGIGQALGVLSQLRATAGKLDVLLQTPLEMATPRTLPGTLSGRLSIENVSFRYASQAPDVLSDVSFEVPEGAFVAIVGGSGSGKSTLMRLLLGFERPTKGQIRYDGQELDRLDLGALRRQIGVVLQHGRLSMGSLLENLAPGRALSADEAWAALEAVGLAEEVRAWPMRLATLVSEGGGNLSGGQRQRLLMARALVGRPKLLLLDEATSALDATAQAHVHAHLATLGVTRVVVAHRLSTIAQADLIVVLEGGRLAEMGTFESLRAQQGPFAALIEAQLR